MIADSACGQPSSCTRKSVQKPNLPSSASNSGSVHREAQQQCGGDIKQSPKTPMRKHNSLPADQGSGTKGQKRKRGSARRQVQKRCKTTELDNSAVTCTGSQSNALEPDKEEPDNREPDIQEPDNQEPDNQEPDINLDSTLDDNKPETTKANSLNPDPIQYWAHNQRWPENFAKMTQNPSAHPEKEVPDISYTQRCKNGEVPQAYSAAYEQHLLEHGVDMTESAGRSRVSKDSKKLYEELLRGTHEEPQNTMFPISRFSSVLERLEARNEPRVVRDLTPLLVPSPELLFASGQNELEHLVEEINVEWTNCKTLAGPMPKPDFAIGLAASAFSKEEMTKLKNYTTPDRPTAFANNLYFPFVLCEVKCGEQGISRADRQNMHSASIAVNAITMLNETLGPKNMEALEGKTLVYSISHHNEIVKIYGHLMYQGVFYRSPITKFLLDPADNYGWKKSHDFFREVYRVAYPTHLERIKKALKAMAVPQMMSYHHTLSTCSDVTSEATKESELQEQDPSALSAQEDAIFKKPGTPASRKQKSEVALLQEQLAEQQKQLVEQQKQLAEQQRQTGEELGQAAEGIMKAAELMSQAGEQYDQMTK